MAGEILALVVLIGWIVLAVVVAQDADSRGYNGLLWGLVVFFFGFLGMILYVIRSAID